MKNNCENNIELKTKTEKKMTEKTSTLPCSVVPSGQSRTAITQSEKKNNITRMTLSCLQKPSRTLNIPGTWSSQNKVSPSPQATSGYLQQSTTRSSRKSNARWNQMMILSKPCNAFPVSSKSEKRQATQWHWISHQGKRPS